MKSARGALVFVFAAFLLSGCIPEDDYIKPRDAYSELYSAIDFKGKECGHRPVLPLVLPKKPAEYGIRLCSISIVRMSCPFHEYPPFCLEIYLDLPGIGP